MNKKGGLTDLFLLIIIGFILVVFGAVMIYSVTIIQDEVVSEIEQTGLVGDGNNNATEVVESSLGAVEQSYGGLYWISILLIFGMILSILVGSFLVTTKPIFFLPYIVIVIIAIIISAGISNAYGTITETEELTAIFANYLGANFILFNLPYIIAVVGFTGGIIMFARMGSKQEVGYYGQ